jgi:hypothetical protein
MRSPTKRKKNLIRHDVRWNSLLKIVIEGRMVCKKCPRMDIIGDLREGSYAEMKRWTEAREK